MITHPYLNNLQLIFPSCIILEATRKQLNRIRSSSYYQCSL